MKITAVIEGYWLDKKLSFSPRTVANYTHFFNRFISFVGDVEFNGIVSNDVRRFLHHLETADELRQWVEASGFIEYQTNGKSIKRARPNGEMIKAMILTFVDTSLRVSELCALTIGDYDAKRGRLYVRAGKGNKGHFVVMGNRKRKVIWKYLSIRPGAKAKEPLFATKTDAHLECNNVRHMLDAIAKQADVNNVHPHRFRHT